MMATKDLITKRERKFLPPKLKFSGWSTIQKFYDDLLSRKIESTEDLRKLLLDWSELEDFASEAAIWAYIKKDCDSADPKAEKEYLKFIKTIDPHRKAASIQLNRKIISSPSEVRQKLKKEEAFHIFFRQLENDLICSREENIPLEEQAELLEKEYYSLQSKQTISFEGRDMTIAEATFLLKSPDRNIRRRVYGLINEQRQQNSERIDQIFSELIRLRHQIALNSQFKNYRDYTFVNYDRSDYTPEDCFIFHQSIKEEVAPLAAKIALKRKENLKIDSLKPFDLYVDEYQREPLTPFKTTEELVDKMITLLERVDPFISLCLEAMKKKKRLDLDNRKNKSPGAYNVSLPESGIPFVFSNVTPGTPAIFALAHETGHAVHAILTYPLPINSFREGKKEVHELASMSMEFFTFPHLGVFLNDETEIKRAKRDELVGSITSLTQIVLVDAFQHWVYENPFHTPEERKETWVRLLSTFSSRAIDWEGYEASRDTYWQSIHHIITLPFYYIEYAIAGLGALALYRNYLQNPRETLKNYLAALRLGNTVSVPSFFAAAGIKFDFSREYIRSLMGFVEEQLKETL